MLLITWYDVILILSSKVWLVLIAGAVCVAHLMLLNLFLLRRAITSMSRLTEALSSCKTLIMMQTVVVTILNEEQDYSVPVRGGRESEDSAFCGYHERASADEAPLCLNFCSHGCNHPWSEETWVFACDLLPCYHLLNHLGRKVTSLEVRRRTQWF